MAQPYVGEIRMFAGNFAPLGWMFCEGQLLSIAEHDTLFTLIGTTYGGDGQTTFALPDLRGRVPIHMGAGPGLTSRALSETGGTETETLTVQQVPRHAHPLHGTSALADAPDPAGRLHARSTSADLYTAAPATAALAPQAIASTGGSQPHDNLMPYRALSFIISLFGIYPSPT